MSILKRCSPYADNPRNNTAEAIDKVAFSIREYGFRNPIIVNKENTILCGHTRYHAAKKLNLNEVPIIKVTDLTPKQERGFRIADNKVSEYSEWDMDVLTAELEQLQEMDFDLSLTGFDMDELDSLLETEEEPEVTEDEYEVELPSEPKAKVGDIYQLGRHRLICGDSTDKATIERLMDGVKADLYLTDPPYNVNYQGGTKDKLTIQNDNMEDSQFYQFLYDAFSTADNVMKKGAVFYIWHADSEGYNFRKACRDVGWEMRQCLIWNKNAMVLGRQDYHWKHEPCLYGWKSGASHLWASDRKQTTVLDFDKPTRNGEHPTMKPVKLFDYQIQNNTKQEDVVLDTFGGSGTTLIACEQNNRISYTCELDPKYIDVIIDRWEQLTGEKAVLLNVEVA